MAWILIDDNLIDESEIVSISKPPSGSEIFMISLRGGVKLSVHQHNGAQDLWNKFLVKTSENETRSGRETRDKFDDLLEIDDELIK